MFPTCTFHTQLPAASCHCTDLQWHLAACLSQPPPITAATPVRAPGLQQSTGKAEEAGTSCSSQQESSCIPSGNSCAVCLYQERLEPGMPEHTGLVQPCCAGTKRRISAVLWFSLNLCGLNLCSKMATWGDGSPKKGAVPYCVPPRLLREPFTWGPLSSSLFGNISMPCMERTLLDRSCCCTDIGNTQCEKYLLQFQALQSFLISRERRRLPLLY